MSDVGGRRSPSNNLIYLIYLYTNIACLCGASSVWALSKTRATVRSHKAHKDPMGRLRSGAEAAETPPAG